MVKGISRQVIVVHSPDPKLFEQAIFILKDEAIGNEGITDDALMKEARKLISGSLHNRKASLLSAGPVWAVGGALVTGIIWAITLLL